MRRLLVAAVMVLTLGGTGIASAAPHHAAACPKPGSYRVKLESDLAAVQWLIASHLPKHKGRLPYLPTRAERREQAVLYRAVNVLVDDLGTGGTICKLAAS